MNKKRIILLIIFISLIAVLGLFFFFGDSIRKSSLFDENGTKLTKEEASTTSTAETAQEDFTGGDDRKPSGRPEGEGSGTVSDDQGNVTDAGDQINWKKSSTGEITVYSPTGGLLKSGDKIIGESSLDRIHFRLMDDVTGVISQGSLNVVNGKYAGTFDFFTNGTKGRLDVFGTKKDGVEFSIVEVPIRFK